MAERQEGQSLGGRGEEKEEDDYDLIVEKQRMKAAIHYAVGRICEDVSMDTDVNISKDVMAAITEMTTRQCTTFATDLELFAKHARRTIVNVDDVKLCCRRSRTLLNYISKEIEKLKKDKGQGVEKRNKQATSNKETPIIMEDELDD